MAAEEQGKGKGAEREHREAWERTEGLEGEHEGANSYNSR